MAHFMTAPNPPIPDPDRGSPACHAVLPCAGNGSRAGTPVPKQYQTVAGQPMVLHTLQALAAVDRIVSTLVVVQPGDAFWPPLADALPPSCAALVEPLGWIGPLLPRMPTG